MVMREQGCERTAEVPAEGVTALSGRCNPTLHTSTFCSEYDDRQQQQKRSSIHSVYIRFAFIILRMRYSRNSVTPPTYEYCYAVSIMPVLVLCCVWRKHLSRIPVFFRDVVRYLSVTRYLV